MNMSTKHNAQVRIQTSFHRFTDIGQIFYDKYIFNNNNKIFHVEIWIHDFLGPTIKFHYFPGLEIKFFNSMTFQVFNGQYEPCTMDQWSPVKSPAGHILGCASRKTENDGHELLEFCQSEKFISRIIKLVDF